MLMAEKVLEGESHQAADQMQYQQADVELV